MNVAALIPAYNPGVTLVKVVRELTLAGIERVVVVDDGSQPDSQAVFEALREIPGCTVLRHQRNLGKGQALKTGLRFVHDTCADGLLGVVTADADGQHLPADIVRVAQALTHRPSHLVLGVRTFEGSVPVRSVFGNTLTRFLFAALVGTWLADTQTGLRGIPCSAIPYLLAVSGDRYDYEMNVLVASRMARLPLHEVPISTVYLDGNRSSHFRPLWDSMSIYAVLFRFIVSSAFTAVIDLVLFASFLRFHHTVPIALVMSRSMSSVLYLYLKKDVVFRTRRPLATLVIRYYALVCCMGGLSLALMGGLAALGWRDVMANKIAVELLLFWVSFFIQRDLIFSPYEVSPYEVSPSEAVPMR